MAKKDLVAKLKELEGKRVMVLIGGLAIVGKLKYQGGEREEYRIRKDSIFLKDIRRVSVNNKQNEIYATGIYFRDNRR